MRYDRKLRWLPAALTGLLLAATAAAQGAAAPTLNNPVGLWKISAYDDTKPGMPVTGVQEICFQAGGTWYSPVFVGWGGIWFQKGGNAAGNGDRVRVLGQAIQGAGTNDSAELDYVNTTLMSGPWTEWTDNANPPPPPFFAWDRVKLCYVGPLCPPPPTGLAPASPPLALSNSDSVAATCVVE
jgi:hypothetical protein